MRVRIPETWQKVIQDVITRTQYSFRIISKKTGVLEETLKGIEAGIVAIPSEPDRVALMLFYRKILAGLCV